MPSSNLSTQISAAIAGILTADYSWQLLGYRKQPKRGKIFDSFIPKDKLVREQAVWRELLIASLDVTARCLTASAPSRSKTPQVCLLGSWNFSLRIGHLECMALKDMGCDVRMDPFLPYAVCEDQR